jgi:transcriptional regulator with XRE-family HTH domain
MEAFANRLRSDRERAGLTIRQLANQSGISFSYISKIETGRSGKGISPNIVTMLAKVLDVDALEYMYLSDVVPSPLKELLSDEQSRHVLHGLLRSRTINPQPSSRVPLSPIRAR